MSSKGCIGIKRRRLSHIQPTSFNHIQSTVCSNKSKPFSKKNFKIHFGDSFVKGIHAKVMSTLDEEKVEMKMQITMSEFEFMYCTKKWSIWLFYRITH